MTQFRPAGLGLSQSNPNKRAMIERLSVCVLKNTRTQKPMTAVYSRNLPVARSMIADPSFASASKPKHSDEDDQGVTDRLATTWKIRDAMTGRENVYGALAMLVELVMDGVVSIDDIRAITAGFDMLEDE